MIHRYENCGSELGKIRSPLTDMEYCLQCGAAVSDGDGEQSEGEKKADENDAGPEVDDSPDILKVLIGGLWVLTEMQTPALLYSPP